MAILRRSPRSVLWLVEWPDSRARLRAAAAAVGVAPWRLVFSARIAQVSGRARARGRARVEVKIRVTIRVKPRLQCAGRDPLSAAPYPNPNPNLSRASTYARCVLLTLRSTRQPTTLAPRASMRCGASSLRTPQRPNTKPHPNTNAYPEPRLLTPTLTPTLTPDPNPNAPPLIRHLTPNSGPASR